MKFQNKAVVVCGAGSGTGRRIAEAFAGEGAHVLAVLSRANASDASENNTANGNKNIEVYDASSAKAPIEYAAEKFGTFDILVNCPEQEDRGEGIADVGDETFEDTMQRCLDGPMQMMRFAVSYFEKQKKAGNIINVAASSFAGGVSACMANTALIALTRNTTFMYMPKNIRCNLIDLNSADAVNAAEIALFLASDEAGYINGVTFPADDAHILQSK